MGVSEGLQPIWVLVEHREGRVPEASLEALTAARRLADEASPSRPVHALALGPEASACVQVLARHGADRVYIGEAPAGYTPEALGARVSAAWGAALPEPALLICPGTRTGREVALRVAAHRRLSFAPDVIRLRWHDQQVEGDRLAFGGKVCSTWRGVRVVALRPDTIRVRQAPRGGDVHNLPGRAEAAAAVRLLDVHKADPRTVPLEQAEFIVAGGNGVRDFRLIWEFADLVGAAVGGSRVVCDDGRLERSRQIGESGVIVSPRCYIAVGISGAIQHVRGMQNSELVITINTDRHAPIHDLASLAVIGDAHAVLRALIDALKARKASPRSAEIAAQETERI